MYHKLKDYLDLSLEDRLIFLRKNGYDYNIEQTAYLPDDLLADFKDFGGVNKAPRVNPVAESTMVAGKQLLVAYALYLNEEMQQKYAPPKYVNELNHFTFGGRDARINFYTCNVQNVLNGAAAFKKEMGDKVKVRVYLSFGLAFLEGLFRQNDVEVYTMQDFPEKPNRDYADYWRLLAMGDAANADYTICLDASEPDSMKHWRFMEDAMKNKAELFSVISPDQYYNNLDIENYFTMTYLNSGAVGVDNRSEFFKKYKMAELLQAYYVVTTAPSHSPFGGIDLYPEFAYRVGGAGLNIDAESMAKRQIYGYGGDQCFLNSVILFGMLNSGGKVLLGFDAPLHVEPNMDYHMIYPYNFLKYLGSKDNAEVIFV